MKGDKQCKDYQVNFEVIVVYVSESMSFLLDEEKTWIQRDFGLDRRLIKALSKLGFTYPTLVQSRCIPIALQGKDVLVRARTGSGQLKNKYIYIHIYIYTKNYIYIYIYIYI
jgi:hypothetical protein